MDEKIKPTTLPGFMELLPNEQILFNRMKDTIKRSYEKFGFLPLDTPIIEDQKILLAKAKGETEKQIYTLTKGENELALRFDLTVPLAKYVTEYYDKLTFPFKRYQIGKVYRGEKPQRGRYREFYQCDIDIIGDNKLSILNDAEMPAVIYNTFKELGFNDFTICINNRKILNGLFESLELKDSASEILRIIDKIDKVGIDKIKEELESKINKEKVETIIRFLSVDGDNQSKLSKLEELNIENEIFEEGLFQIKELLKYVSIFGVPDENIKFDLTIARGLDYYTSTVYETFLNNYKNLGSVCSGGRYDNLAEYYTDRKMPGVGISIGLTRLFYQLTEAGLISAEKENNIDVLVISMSDTAFERCAEIATQLRNSGLNVQVNLEDQKIGKKFKNADNLNVKYVAIIGEDEIKNDVISLKNMETGEQQTLSMDQAIQIIK